MTFKLQQREFEDIGHSSAAIEQLEKYVKGNLEGYVPPAKSSSDVGSTSSALVYISTLCIVIVRFVFCLVYLLRLNAHNPITHDLFQFYPRPVPCFHVVMALLAAVAGYFLMQEEARAASS